MLQHRCQRPPTRTSGRTMPLLRACGPTELPCSSSRCKSLNRTGQQLASTALQTLAAAAVLWSAPSEAWAALTPYQEAQRLVYGPTADGSIRSCPSNVNPNCVSTASTNDSYSPVWRANETSLDAAAEVLELGVQAALPEAQLVKVSHLAQGEYRAYTVKSPFGKDVVEFVLKPDGVIDRNWEGDKPGVLVTYRSMAGSVKYLWPIQQPISDFDAQRKRMTAIREQLGWPVIGCELLECYE